MVRSIFFSRTGAVRVVLGVVAVMVLAVVVWVAWAG